MPYVFMYSIKNSPGIIDAQIIDAQIIDALPPLHIYRHQKIIVVFDLLLRQLLYIENFFFIRLCTTITLVSQNFQKKIAYFFLCDLSFAHNMSRVVNNEKISKKVRFIVSLLNKLIQRMYSSYINSIVTTIYYYLVQPGIEKSPSQIWAHSGNILYLQKLLMTWEKVCQEMNI